MAGIERRGGGEGYEDAGIRESGDRVGAAGIGRGRQGRTAHDTQRGTRYKTSESEDGRCVGWPALWERNHAGAEYMLCSRCFVSLRFRAGNLLPPRTWQCSGPANGADGDEDERMVRIRRGK